MNQIDALSRELSRPQLYPLVEFITEHQGKFIILYGFLFEPYFQTPVINPLARKTRKSNSPYFCAKIPLYRLGSVFLIPQVQSDNMVLVLKPERRLRLSISLQSVTIPPARTTVIQGDYLELVPALVEWSVAYQALYSR